MSKKYLFILVLCFFCETAVGYNPQHLEYGIGFLLPISDTDCSFNHLHPTSITVYEQPNGKTAGKLIKEAQDDAQRYFQSYLQTHSTKILIDSDVEFITIDYNGSSIKVYEEKNGFILILSRQLKKGVWISLSELKTNNYRYVTYKTYIMSSKKEFSVLGYFGVNILNLRSGPSTHYPLILPISNNPSTGEFYFILRHIQV